MNIINNLSAQRPAAHGRFRGVCIAFLALQLCPATAYAADHSQPAPGSVTAWGYNAYGQLGIGATYGPAYTNSTTPILVYLPPGVTASTIAAGYFHSLALTNDGVYFWGAGTAAGVASSSAMKVVFPPAVTTISAIAAGGGHDLAITNDGLYAWGGNSSGQVGDGTTTDRPTPVKVLFPFTVTQVTAVAAGAYHSLAVTNDGVYAWGGNAGGQLGDGTRINRSAPVKVALPWNPITTALAGGGYHSLAITEDGVYTWGNNTFGQLGDGSTQDRLVPVLIRINWGITNIAAIAAGFWHSLAVTNDGLYAFGYNGNGELGDGSFVSRALPVKTAMPKAVTAVKSIAAGDMHSLAATDDGVYAWGNNSWGQLGVGSTNRQNVPNKIRSETKAIAVAAGYYHSLALH